MTIGAPWVKVAASVVLAAGGTVRQSKVITSADFRSDTIAWSQNGGRRPTPPRRACPASTSSRAPARIPFNAQSHGVLTALIVGSHALDASLVDVDPLRLGREDGEGGMVGRVFGPPGPHPMLVDLASADEHAEVCDDVPPGSDGRLDLVLEFDSAGLAHEPELGGLPKNTPVQLVLRGELFDGTPLAIEDCLKPVNS